MGDRANIFISEPTKENPTNGIYFYTHYNGDNLFSTLQSALIRGKDRWDDPQYLNRIIFCEMIKNDVLSNTGYGITTYLCDNGHPIITVNSKKQRVTLCKEGNEPKGKDYYSFEKIISMSKKELNKIYNGD